MEKTIEIIPEEIMGLMKEVSAKEVLIRRLNKEKGVVIKVKNKLFLITDPSTEFLERIRTFFVTTICSKCEICRGGELCKKVADFSKESTKRTSLSYVEAIADSKRIEKYPFVTLGVEAFNYTTGNEFILIKECRNFKRISSKGRENRWEATWTNT